MEAPQPRLCHVAKRTDFMGYGFNLHAEKARPGQFIGKVDENSPAVIAGLKEGDRIIEVNGVNISQENHKQVVQRIKAVPHETTLLVVDKMTDEYYKKQGILVKSSMPNVLYKSSEMSIPPPPEASEAVVTTTTVVAEVNGNFEENVNDNNNKVNEEPVNNDYNKSVSEEQPDSNLHAGASPRSSTSSMDKVRIFSMFFFSRCSLKKLPTRTLAIFVPNFQIFCALP